MDYEKLKKKKIQEFKDFVLGKVKEVKKIGDEDEFVFKASEAVKYCYTQWRADLKKAYEIEGNVGTKTINVLDKSMLSVDLYKIFAEEGIFIFNEFRKLGSLISNQSSAEQYKEKIASFEDRMSKIVSILNNHYKNSGVDINSVSEEASPALQAFLFSAVERLDAEAANPDDNSLNTEGTEETKATEETETTEVTETNMPQTAGMTVTVTKTEANQPIVAGVKVVFAVNNEPRAEEVNKDAANQADAIESDSSVLADFCIQARSQGQGDLSSTLVNLGVDLKSIPSECLDY